MTAKTLTMRLKETEANLLNEIMNDTNFLNTGSKTLIHCLQEYQPLMERIKDLEFAKKNLEEKIAAYEVIIKQ